MGELFLQNFFDDFDNFFGFGRPYNLKFNVAKTKDISPVRWEPIYSEEDNEKIIGYKGVCRTVGIAPDDVKIEFKDERLIVSGETAFDKEKYNTYFEIPILHTVAQDIEKIDYTTTNGITYIYIYTKQKIQNEVKINKK